MTGAGLAVHEHRGVDVGAGDASISARRSGLVEQALHLRADDVAGDADAAGAAEVERAGEQVVVAGEDGQAVDQLQLVLVGLLEALDAVDLRQLGQQVRRHVGRRAAGDVVEDDRRAAGRAGDLLEVAPDAAAVGLVVVRRDAQHGVDARASTACSVSSTAWRVSLEPVPPTIDAPRRRSSSGDQADDAEVLLVGQRRGLARSCRRRPGRRSRWRAGGAPSRRRRPRRRGRPRGTA